MTRNIYLALGDSVTFGYDASHPNLTFVRQVSESLRKKSLAEQTLVVARNGWDSRDLLRMIRTIPASVWDRTHVLTLLIGGNDLRKLLRRQFFFATPLSPKLIDQKIDEFSYNMGQLCQFIAQKRIPHVLVSNVYNPVPHSQISDYAINRLNDVIRECASQYHFDLIDVHKAFEANESSLIHGYRNGSMEDLSVPFNRPIHPNNTGHQKIAELINQILEQKIPSARAENEKPAKKSAKHGS